MMWLLLFGLTALVVLLPMVPALIEWQWPTDLVPLFIDKDDALDPPFLARAFASRLATARALRQIHLGRSRITTFVPLRPWPLNEGERAAAASQRVWDVVGDAELPAGVSFLGEVAAQGSVRAAAGGIYRALWAGANLHLPPRCTVLRWAHGTRVDVGASCDLAGRVTAEERISVGNGAQFALLHAPRVEFAPTRPPSLTLPSIATTPFDPGLYASVLWDPVSARGRSHTALDIGPGRRWSGDLVCGANLRMGAGCKVQGSLKAHGSLTLGACSAVSGSLVAVDTITLGPGCTVHGSVISETTIVLGAGCVIGVLGHPSTVAAPRVDAGSGVVVHGTVWAGERGRCLGAETVRPLAAATGASARASSAAREATA